MRKIARFAGAVSALAASWLVTSPAAAEHLFVSPFGNDDTGNGTPSAPLETLQGAIDFAGPGSAFIQLEMGGNYGPGVVGPGQNLTIFSTQGGGVFDPDGPGILVNGDGSTIVTLDGVTIGGATIGVQFNSGHKLNVRNTTIQDISGGGSGILFRPNINAELNVGNTVITNTGDTGDASGIRIDPRAGADVTGVLDNVTLQNNRAGLVLDAGSGVFLDIAVADSTISGNSIGLQARGAGSELRVRETIVIGNGTGLHRPNGGKIESLEGNSVTGNTTDGSANSTVPQT